MESVDTSTPLYTNNQKLVWLKFWKRFLFWENENILHNFHIVGITQFWLPTILNVGNLFIIGVLFTTLTDE